MQQVLLTLPFGIPVFGYGTMLFVAYVACTWLAIRLGRREGIAREVFQDITLWFFVFGILGARLTYVIENWRTFKNIGQFFAIWDGGLVFYGSIPGAILGFIIADRYLQKRHPYDRWKMADTVAPCVALGLAIGRVGCLLNGCCFGNVACAGSPAIHFPLAGPPRFAMVERGYQTAAGFTLDRDMQRQVDFVEPGSLAEAAGLKAGDVITKVNGVDIVAQDKNGRESFVWLHEAFRGSWPRGKNDLLLTVEGPSGRSRDVGPIAPKTLGLHPTQIYETISMILLLFFLVSYYPYKKRDGAIMVLFMLGYGVHRFLNELLRTDNDIVAFDMTLSQNVSLLVLACAFLLWFIIRRRPALHAEPSHATI